MIVFGHVSKEMLSPKVNARDNIPSHFFARALASSSANEKGKIITFDKVGAFATGILIIFPLILRGMYHFSEYVF